MAHHHVFQSRKSSIYQKQPDFAYFGLGAYTFAPYKVTISGMHKQSLFRAIGPEGGQPVIVDDTCYLLPCSSNQQAALLTALLNHPHCQQFIAAIVFWDAKRPITKSLLQRINLHALLAIVDRTMLVQAAEQLLAEMTLRSPDPTALVDWPHDLTALLDCGQYVAKEPSVRLQPSSQFALFPVTII